MCKWILHRILKLKLFRNVDESFLDIGLAKAMKEVEDEEEYDVEEAKKLSGFKE